MNSPSGSGSRAPMCGRSARTVRSTASGGRVKSSARSRGLDLVRVGDAVLGLLGERRALVERADEQVAAEALQPRRERAVVVVGRGSARAPCRQTGPASSASTSRMIETPVSSSPAMIARSIGAAPRQRGSSDGCTLRIS